MFSQWPGSHCSQPFQFTGVPAITHFSSVFVTVLLSVLTTPAATQVYDSVAIKGVSLGLKGEKVCAGKCGQYVYTCFCGFVDKFKLKPSLCERFDGPHTSRRLYEGSDLGFRLWLDLGLE